MLSIMKQTSLIKLFISYPSDILQELLDAIRLIVDEINKTTGNQGGYRIETLNWDDDVYSAIGTDPQDAINKQIDDVYDILVSIIWQKLGTPTKRDKSGTVEEINRAISNPSKHFLIYFNTQVEDLDKIDVEELQRINDFKKELSDKGVVYKQFNSIDEFEKQFRLNLTSLISDNLRDKKININEIKSTGAPENKYAKMDEFIRKGLI